MNKMMKFILNLLFDCLLLIQDLENLFPFFCVNFARRIPYLGASLIRLDHAYLFYCGRSKNLSGLLPRDLGEHAEETCEVTPYEELLSALNIYDNLMLIT